MLAKDLFVCARRNATALYDCIPLAVMKPSHTTNRFLSKRTCSDTAFHHFQTSYFWHVQSSLLSAYIPKFFLLSSTRFLQVDSELVSKLTITTKPSSHHTHEAWQTTSRSRARYLGNGTNVPATPLVLSCATLVPKSIPLLHTYGDAITQGSMISSKKSTQETRTPGHALPAGSDTWIVIWRETWWSAGRGRVVTCGTPRILALSSAVRPHKRQRLTPCATTVCI